MTLRSIAIALLTVLVACPAFAATPGLDPASDPALAQAIGQALSQGAGTGLSGMGGAIPGLQTIPGLQQALTAKQTRTFNELNNAELDRLSRATLAYYRCVAEKTTAVTGADKRSTERIFATYPPFILIMRQQCRIGLINVEKELYGLRLNPEFITNHVNTLRDDVVHFALQEVLKQTGADKAPYSGTDIQSDTARRGAGFGLFAPKPAASSAPATSTPPEKQTPERQKP